MSGGAIFEYGWREDHAGAGDEALAVAEEVAGKYSDVSVMAKACAYAAIAQAHYAAANVRAKRPPADEHERNEIVEAAAALVGDWYAERSTDGGRLRLAVNAWQAING